LKVIFVRSWWLYNMLLWPLWLILATLLFAYSLWDPGFYILVLIDGNLSSLTCHLKHLVT
jgi:hypothetical protein